MADDELESIVLRGVAASEGIAIGVWFSIAHATDSSLISIPHTVSADAAIDRPIVPIPQYRSYTVSPPVSPAYPRASS